MALSAARALRTLSRRTRTLSSAPAAVPTYEPHVVDQALIDKNGGLMEYSVVYTDRAMNHMSAPFQQIMNDLHTSLTKAYNTDHAVMLPGSGTYAMEAAARAFGTGDVVVVRNGYFSRGRGAERQVFPRRRRGWSRGSAEGDGDAVVLRGTETRWF